jgi:hypothetical protein
MPYLEYLGEFWGELCTTPEIASNWADYLSPTLTTMWNQCARSGECGYFKGATACLRAVCSRPSRGVARIDNEVGVLAQIVA